MDDEIKHFQACLINEPTIQPCTVHFMFANLPECQHSTDSSSFLHAKMDVDL